MKRIFLACLTCVFAVAAVVLAWIPVHSAPPAGLAFQETIPPEGWTVCEVGGLEYIQEVNEVRQVFTVCNASGWQIKAYCTQPGVPAPDGGSGCSYGPDGNFWCGSAVQILKFFAIIEEPLPTETPTPTPTNTPTVTPTPTSTDSGYLVDTPTSTSTDVGYPVDTPTSTSTDVGYPVDTSTSTPTGTATQVDSSTSTPTNTPTGDAVIVTVSPPVTPGNDLRPFPGGPGNRSFVVLGLVAMSLIWGIAIWAVVLRRHSGRS